MDAPDRLAIRGLRYRGLHGWYEVEREKGNDFEVDLEVTGRFREADDLTQVPDYQAMERVVREVMHGRNERLIERLCERIGEGIVAMFGREGSSPAYRELVVRVRKCPPPIDTPCEHAEIEMRWRHDG